MSTKDLQGTLFGGFKRKGVIAYIEKTSREHEQQLTALRQENEKLQALQQDISELNALREENEQMKNELSELRAETESLRVEAEEYRGIKDHLAELQMEAVRCAKEIERNAHERAEKTESVAYARIRAVSRESKTRFDESFAFVDDLLNAASPKLSEEETVE